MANAQREALALLASEFPDFPADSLPSNIPACMAPSHWRNDLCPSWRSPDGEIVLWIDYPSAADREFPSSARYVIAGDEDGCVEWELDDWTHARAALVGALARRHTAAA